MAGGAAAATVRRSREAAELGHCMFVRGMVIRGELSVSDWREFLIECAEAMDMTPIADAGVWEYPVGGKGGKGFTIVQPITESFLALDTWPDHGGAYLFAVSCKEFMMHRLREVVVMAGLDYDEFSETMTLRLVG